MLPSALDGSEAVVALHPEGVDRNTLSASEHPAAVTPGPTLQHHAEKEGWQVLDWR